MSPSDSDPTKKDLSTHTKEQIKKTVHLEGVHQAIVERAKLRASTFSELLKQLNSFTTDILEHLADILSHQVKQPIQQQQQIQQQSAPPAKTTPIIPQTIITKPTNKTTYEIRQQYETLQPPVSPKAQYKATHNRQINGVDVVAS